MSAVRADLLLLSPEALSHAANAGIVKRAVRELAGGYRPKLVVDATGEIEATFDDGVSCRWPPGATIQSVRCSCGAAGVCRHRVIVALAYRESVTADGADPAPAVAPVASASDDALARLIPASLLAEARLQRDAGVSIEVRRRAGGEPCDTARLPSATVRFWGGAALETARCDCLRASACEHVALGVWAFRAADEQDSAAAHLTVRLGAQGHREAIDHGPFHQIVEAVARHGVARGGAALMQPLSSARVAAADAAWISLVVADLETWCEAYAKRSALYDPAQGVDLLAELTLRLTAGGLPGHGGAVLGTGQSGETALDRLRLMCLGARTQRDGEGRRTTLVMADIDTGTRLVITHDWQVPEARGADEAALRAAERLAPGVRLEALAQGQLLAQQAARRPDGSVRLARARSSQNSVLPQSADWAQLGSPVRFDNVAALRAEQMAHPNAALQPRHAARRFIVFSPAEVEEPVYDANSQCVAMVLRDAQGEPLLLRRFHERHAPHALDAIAAAGTRRHGELRHVAGVLSWHHGVPSLDPWAIACDGLVVPDFANAEGALAALPLGMAELAGDDPCARHLEALRQHLALLLHHGLAGLPRTWPTDTAALAQRLDAAGLRELSQGLRALGPEVAAAQANPADARLAPALTPLLALRQLHADAATLDQSPHTP
ncbi:hypothetical protein [Ideonella sp.]|uniref:hypothetical protein n=1 Tax=Ideonella sp. TaxID=1929293 RepID=UPI0035B1D0A7